MFGKNSLPRWLDQQSVVGAVALLLVGALPVPGSSLAAPVSASPPPPGTARIWIYRDYEPYGSRNYTTVSVNGTTVGYVRPEGTVLYRDVAPGRYHITVASEGEDVNQDRWVDLAAGQQAFVKVLASTTWDAGGDKAIYTRDTFYARLVPPQIAQAELAGGQ